MSAENRLRAWMTSALIGNQEDYAEFLKLAAKLIRSYLMKAIPTSQLHSKDIVEDLVQDVLISIHRKRHTYRVDAPILPWLFAIAKYRWIDYSRMLKVRPELLSWDAEEAEWEDESEPHRRSEASQELAGMLKNLSPQQQELIRLAKLEELPLAEIADRLQLSLSSVKVGIHRAIEKMKKMKGAR